MTCNENLNYEDFYQSYVRILNENGLGEYTDDATVKGFYRLTELLLNENKKTNLTAITGIEDVITKHLQALACRVFKADAVDDHVLYALEREDGGGIRGNAHALARKSVRRIHVKQAR